MKDKFCPNCGNKLAADTKFCEHCGHKVDEDVKQVSENAIDKLKTQSKNGVEKVAKVASEKTGRNIKPSYVIGLIVVLVVLIGGFFVLRPKPLEGPYTAKVSNFGEVEYVTINFEGNNKIKLHAATGVEKNGKFKEEAKSNAEGTYKVDGDKLKIHDSYLVNGKRVKEDIKGTISKDKDSFKISKLTFKKGERP